MARKIVWKDVNDMLNSGLHYMALCSHVTPANGLFCLSVPMHERQLAIDCVDLLWNWLLVSVHLATTKILRSNK